MRPIIAYRPPTASAIGMSVQAWLMKTNHHGYIYKKQPAVCQFHLVENTKLITLVASKIYYYLKKQYTDFRLPYNNFSYTKRFVDVMERVNKMNAVKIAVIATFATVMLPAIALADDFEDLCTGVDKSEPTVKSCACASGKITGADRTAAMDAMKAMNAAIASGKPEDAATATSKHAKGLEIVMTAQATCL